MINFDYVRPSTQEAALAAKNKESKSQFIAGGTNLVDLMKRGVSAPDTLIDINNLLLKNIDFLPGTTRIGALVLNSVLADDKNIILKHPLLSDSLKAGASAQIRNMATVGGNMLQRTRCPYFYDIYLPCNKRNPGSGCGALQGYNRMHAIFGASESCIAVHPSDMCIALAALNAVVIVASAKAEKRIPFVDFHRLPGNDAASDNNLKDGEMIIAVEIPDDGKFSKNSAYLKVRDRSSYAFALVSAGVALHMNGNIITEARLAMGGVAHKPWRLTKAEEFLKGKKATNEYFQQAAAIAMEGAKAYGRNNFKLKLAPATLVQAMQKAAGQS